MATCSTWPHCAGSGRRCWNSCPPLLAGTSAEGMPVSEQNELMRRARERNRADDGG